MEIQVKNVWKKIRGTIVLEDVNISMNSGHIYGLQGPNGSGKTMLLRVISGLIRPSSGTVLIDDRQLTKDIDFPESMGLMIENPAFYPFFDGVTNLALLAEIKNKVTKEDVATVIQKVGLDPYSKKKYGKYSLGMKQRLGIAAAIMEKPDLILLDEPTNALDVDGIHLIENLIVSEKERGALIVVASHDGEFLDRISDEIYLVTEGRLRKKDA